MNPNQYQEESATKKAPYSFPIVSMGKTTIDNVLLKMQSNNIKTILIAEDDIPKGIVTESDVVKFIYSDKTGRSLDKIPVSEIMKKTVFTITKDSPDPLRQSAIRMEMFKIGSIVVVNDDGKPEGIITKTDIANAYSKTFPGKASLADYMNTKVATCRESDSVGFAHRIIEETVSTAVVVTDSMGTPVGVFTRNLLSKTKNIARSSDTDRYTILTKRDNYVPVEKFLTGPPLIMRTREDLAEAACFMVVDNLVALPVVDKGGFLAGVVTRWEIIQAYNHLVNKFY